MIALLAKERFDKNIYCFTSLCLGGDRKFAAQVRGAGMPPADVPEWKKHITGGQKASYGKKEKKSLLEQRQSLPIYKLKDELVKVLNRACSMNLSIGELQVYFKQTDAHNFDLFLIVLKSLLPPFVYHVFKTTNVLDFMLS